MDNKVCSSSVSYITTRQNIFLSALSIGVVSAILFSYVCRKKILSSVYNWTIRRIINSEKKIFTISDSSQWDSIYPKFIREAETVGAIGLDCEWTQVSGKKRPVALLQLATHSGLCALIQVNHLKKTSTIPISLKNLLSDEDIIKAGVASDMDRQYLLSDHALTVNGVLDLRELEKRILAKRYRTEIKDGDKKTDYAPKMGLYALTKKYLGRNLNKDWKIRGGDWEVQELSNLQKDYAADDALVGIQLLIKMAYELSESSEEFSNSLITLKKTKIHIRKVCKDHIDRVYKGSSSANNSTSASSSCQSIQNKMRAKDIRRSYSTRKSPLYHNSLLLAPDGETLCTCDPDKARWYVTKELGDLVTEDPLVVKLRFEPAGRPNREGKDGKFYLQERFNMCVVCGLEDSYIRKNIVPHEYRKYFPSILKTHQSHDVVLLCVDCHQQSNIKDNSFRQQFAETFQAPIGSETDIKQSVDPNLKVIRNAGSALLKSRHKLPPARLEYLENVLKNYYKTDDLTDDQVTFAANLNFNILNEEYSPHGYKIFNIFRKTGLIKLEERWRQWFLDTMKPQFMPENWSISHNHEKLKVKMARYPLDDPIRDDFKECLVGTEGEIDIPYVPSETKERQDNCAQYDSSSSPSR